MLLRRPVVADDGAGAGRPRRRFAVPRLLVGLGAPTRCGAQAPDFDSPTAAAARVGSPTSPLDHSRHFAFRGGGGSSLALLRSPRSPRARSWDSRRLGLRGLVDATDAAIAEPTVAASCKPVPCSSRSCGEVKSGPEVITTTLPGASSSHPHPAAAAAELGNDRLFPEARPGSSLPASIGVGARRSRYYVGSVSATEVEQSEDYTCIIAHGPNPKTTRIFGDCILEPCTLLSAPSDGDADGGVDAMVEVKEGAESYWLVKCFDDGESGEDELLSSCVCVSCQKKLDGNGSCVCRGEKVFCGGDCRDQEVLTEEEENITALSSLSSAGSSSSFNDEIFMAEMVVLAAPVDVHYP